MAMIPSVAVAAQRAPVRARPRPGAGHPRGLVEARRYRLVARRMDRSALPTRLRVSGQAVEDLLAGRVRFLSSAQATRFEALCSKRTARWLRGSPHFAGIAGGEMPVALILPAIHDAWDRDGKERAAQRAGLPMRTIYRIARSNAVSFRLADQVVTNLVGPDAWLEAPLRGWYWGHTARLGM